MVTLKYLQKIAKQKNIRGYSKLRKEGLKTLLRNRLPRGVYKEIVGAAVARSLLDDDIPEIGQQPLQLTQYVPPVSLPKPKPKQSKPYQSFIQKMGDWFNWLT